MSDPRDDLQRKFDEANRHACFGDVLVRMNVQGFRCHRSTVIEIQSPITAFCGLNGTGKSTLLQLAAVAYRNGPSGSYHISDFLVLSDLDPSPFEMVASVEYRFWQADRKTKTLTISRNDRASRWYGYNRRQERTVFFAGIGLYLPRVEKRDFVIRNASSWRVTQSQPVSALIKDWTCRILGHTYDSVVSNTVSHSAKVKQVASVSRQGKSYSETHMGFGEGRVQFLIQALETIPDKSLVLIEEPETSLHQRAQHGFGQYLIDVSFRKGHQILLTTHSEYLLRALPSASRKFLYHGATGVEQLCGLAAAEANSLMTDGHEKALTVLVEDTCAQAVLAEIVAQVDRTFLRTIRIVAAGSAEGIAQAVRTLQQAHLRVVAVRDGDKHDTPRDFIFKLPGNLPPERELFQNADVKKYIRDNYTIGLDDFLASIHGADHHEYFARLSERVARDEQLLVGEAARVYAKTIPTSDLKILVEQLKDAASK